jgi:hypothetical protein
MGYIASSDRMIVDDELETSAKKPVRACFKILVKKKHEPFLM